MCSFRLERAVHDCSDLSNNISARIMAQATPTPLAVPSPSDGDSFSLSIMQPFPEILDTADSMTDNPSNRSEQLNLLRIGER